MNNGDPYEDYDNFQITDPRPPYDKWSQFMDLSKNPDKVPDNASKLLDKLKNEMNEKLTPNVITEIFDAIEDLIKREAPISGLSISFTAHDINQERISNDVMARAV